MVCDQKLTRPDHYRTLDLKLECRGFKFRSDSYLEPKAVFHCRPAFNSSATLVTKQLVCISLLRIGLFRAALTV